MDSIQDLEEEEEKFEDVYVLGEKVSGCIKEIPAKPDAMFSNLALNCIPKDWKGHLCKHSLGNPQKD